MPTIGAYEAKTKFAELLQRAENGERVTITRHGKAVAEIAPVRKVSPEQARRTVSEITKLRKRANVTGVTWDDLKGWMNDGKK